MANSRYFDSFEAQCLRTYVADIVSQDGVHLEKLFRPSKCYGLPGGLLAAIALVEANRRPRYIRFIENFLVLLNGALHAAGLLPMKDVTIGMCQVRLSTAARLSGITCTTEGGWIYVESREGDLMDRVRSIERLLRIVLTEESNASITAEHVAEMCDLWLKDRSADAHCMSNSFLQFIGERYNDHLMKGSEASYIPYGRVLAAVVKERQAMVWEYSSMT